MKAGWFLGVLLALSILPAARVPAQAEPPGAASLSPDAELYLRGLELIVQGSISDAIVPLRQLVDFYPGSPFASRAEALLEKYASRLDRSGIVPFYILNLMTMVSVAEALPSFLGTSDTLVLGLSGLAATGAGIGVSWLLSHDRDISFGQELWMESAQLVTTLDFSILYDLAAPPGDPNWVRFKGLGAAVAAVAARVGAYALAGGSALPSGQPAFIMVNYALSWVYTSAFLTFVLQSPDKTFNSVVSFGLPTAVAAGSWVLWGVLRWPDYRTGLTALGALGGALTGIFADLVVLRLAPTVDTRSLFGIAIGTALAGQVLTAFLTQGIPDELPRSSPVAIRPTVDSKGAVGFQVSLSY
ncbi:MAG TPA: hypothetical protein VMQ10_01570 [Spirochaetia bacterium]|nr:hypothetical protein [Spirochaetia bacterium]